MPTIVSERRTSFSLEMDRPRRRERAGQATGGSVSSPAGPRRRRGRPIAGAIGVAALWRNRRSIDAGAVLATDVGARRTRRSGHRVQQMLPGCGAADDDAVAGVAVCKAGVGTSGSGGGPPAAFRLHRPTFDAPALNLSLTNAAREHISKHPPQGQNENKGNKERARSTCDCRIHATPSSTRRALIMTPAMTGYLDDVRITTVPNDTPRGNNVPVEQKTNEMLGRPCQFSKSGILSLV